MISPRNWLRFSLRTLLIAISICGILLGIRVNAARRQSQAVAELLKMGCEVGYDFDTDANGYGIPLARSYVPDWIISQTGPDLFHNVVYVNLQYGDKDGQPIPSQLQNLAPALTQVARLPRPLHLVLSDLADDDALVEVGKLRSLHKLAVWGNDAITDAGIRHLTNLHGLRELRIIGAIDMKLTDKSLRDLGTMPHLEVIYISGLRFTDEGLSQLRNLRRLRELTVSSFPDVNFTDKGLRHLEQLTELESLDLSIFANEITDEGKQRLRKALPKLKNLSP